MVDTKTEEYQTRKAMHRYPLVEFSLGDIEMEVNELLVVKVD